MQPLEKKPKPKRKTILVQPRLSPQLFSEVREAAQSEGLGIAPFIRRLCAVAMQARKQATHV